MEYTLDEMRGPLKKVLQLVLELDQIVRCCFENESIAIDERTRRKGVSESKKHGVSCGTWYIGRF